MCSQNMTIKIMIADQAKRGLGYFFTVEKLVAPLAALAGATSSEAALKNWLVSSCGKANMVGPFLVQYAASLHEEISQGRTIYNHDNYNYNYNHNNQ